MFYVSKIRDDSLIEVTDTFDNSIEIFERDMLIKAVEDGIFPQSLSMETVMHTAHS